MKAYYQSPVGLLEIQDADRCIVSLRVVETGEYIAKPLTDVLEQAILQLTEYFAGKRINFDLPIKQSGTDFQKKAWDYLSTIPYGNTVSYKEEAIAIGSPKGSRAVGSANGKNNIAIIVPCHRVINESGSLGGYAYGLDMKKFLLRLEQQKDKRLF
ncbi:MAG: methylated-DNA--[protein]-cysteine S-methyltransferase [Dysgonomonas sp.]